LKEDNKMKKILINIALATSFFAVCSDVMSQNVPLRVGMNYTQARNALLDNGWQPFIPSGADLLACNYREFCDRSINLEKALRRQFRANGWYETVHCFPTGKAFCYHQFYDINSRGIVVVTGSGSYKEMPSVVKFYYGDELNR
jgi:hypothetical protein